MKKYLVSGLILTLGLAACSGQSVVQKSTEKKEQSDVKIKSEDAVKTGDVKEAVWNQLDPRSRERIKGTWKDAKVSTVTLSKDMMTLVKDKSYAGKEVYAIDFSTTSNSIPNNMIVYADKKSLDFIGLGLVD
ncbi:hypothetical protein ACFFJY_04365 [Fictibacillus aquaticus]|uniref:Uncharacterized protein n=1 Tax=Fictibacillus aquaticus TaxID=2021314 RepID=A0A235F4G9_9BACL|nr:hypothetical protein [Fictibacillus aquaticus]OYD56094.1 hypothetical protein CGZ90_19350 [Fictibacillus aquaticus]